MEEKYYVIEKIAELERSLNSAIEAMPIKRRAIDIYKSNNKIQRAKDTFSELKDLKDKLLDNIRSLGLLFSECEMQRGADFANKLYASLKKLNLLIPDYSKLTEALERLKNEIPKSEVITGKLIGHLMNNVKMGYFPTDIAHVKMIKSALKFPDCKVNVFDPCCGCGLALETLAQDNNCETYGVELDELRREEAEAKLDRVGFGSFFYSRISHECFHAIFLNPPYLSVMGEGGIKARSEKRFLVEILPHIMMGGVLMYIIPYYRLTWDICRVLCDNFENISVYRFLDDEFVKFKQVVVMGTKKKKEDGSKAAELLSQYAMMPDKIPRISDLQPESYTLPEEPKRVDIFKGEVFNLGELKRQLASSKSIDILFEKSRIDAMEKHPLLPLNIGQVGLIGGSGLINGYVECDKPHVIKGRVIKEVRRRENDEMNTLSETRVNKMLFNILTPDGVKKLA